MAATTPRTNVAPQDLPYALRSGELDTYQQTLPHRCLVDGASIDSKVCARARCRICGHTGLEYRPYVRPEPDYSYRAFCVCPHCGASEEF